MSPRTGENWRMLDQRHGFKLESITLRILDRAAGTFGKGWRERLAYSGCPLNLFADILVSVARMWAGERSV